MLAKMGGMGLSEEEDDDCSLRPCIVVLEEGVTTECERAGCSGDDDDDERVVVMTAVLELVEGGTRLSSEFLSNSWRNVLYVCSFNSLKLCVALTASQQSATA